MMKKTINFNQGKYIIPILILPFLLGIIYLAKDFFEEKQEVTNLETKDELNIEIPDANLESRNTQSKLGALQDAFNKSSDFSRIKEIETEEKKSEVEDLGSLYTTEELRIADSLKKATEAKMAEYEKMNENFDNNYSQGSGEENASSIDDEKKKMEEEMELFKKQMAYIDSLQNPGKFKSEKVVEIQTTGKEKEVIEEVMKVKHIKTSVFNTVQKRETNNLISAILDESTKVVNGSRIRIRLLDDISIGESIIPKGKYLYGIVTGFKAQRVIISISSILVDNKPTKVDLSVYDNDGQEGLFIPASAFRDFSKNVGSQATSQSLSISNGAGGIEQFAYGALQDVYKTAQQAIGKSIKENKAKLKYNTQVYLVNNKEKNN